MTTDKVAVIDFGSQTTQLIARRVREAHVYCEVFPCTVPFSQIQQFAPKAIILSGGPASVAHDASPTIPAGILDMGLPILGICYGMQAMVQASGGKVDGFEHKEFGRARLDITGSSDLLKEIPVSSDVWMSHGDQVHVLPELFDTLASTSTCPHVIIACESKRFYGVQFHPEVVHTVHGKDLLHNFLFAVSALAPSWTPDNYMSDMIADIQARVGKQQVILGLSGGVDSSVAAVLVHQAIGDQLKCIYVDHGLGRLGELDEIKGLFIEQRHIPVTIVDAQDQFLGALKGVTSPEQKRKIAGRVFVEVFEAVSHQYPDAAFLAQGTLYPDVIESQSFHGGPSDVIKSHHNVGGLPEKMKLKLLEPLRALFKDEVRELGRKLGMPKSIIERQPFPGPGLAVRIPGEVTRARCDLLRAADDIIVKEIQQARVEGLVIDNLWQYFGILLPIFSVGVMGDARTYGETICVRCVASVDGMTADWVMLPQDLLGRISNRIMNEVRGISRVVYDISSKPPATIEWE